MIGTANPFVSGDEDVTQSTSQMLQEMERQPITELEMLDEDDQEFSPG